MKNSIFFFSFSLIVVFLDANAVQAQSTPATAMVSNSQYATLTSFASVADTKDTPSTESTKKPQTVNIAAGQHAPRFADLTTYLNTHINYPELARENGIEGTVKVLARVSDNGTVEDVSIVQPLGFGCDEEAMRVVRNMPTWTPAMNYGVPVKGKVVLEINFALQ
ncbi:MAG: energy transducer TonB [Saprospiraceae bacterium]